MSYHPKLQVASNNRKAIHTMQVTGKKRDNDGMKDAFVEMLMVARCNKVIGTTRSTFSLCAAAFQGELPLLVGLKEGPCSIPRQIVFG